jgi:sulfoxide reductase heme-binding subunit YedZ
MALGSAVVVVLFTGLSPFASGRVSINQFVATTGYVALALVGLTLLIGPVNLLLRRRRPASTYQPVQGVPHKPPIHQLLRRDVGTWAAVASVVHAILGFQAHGGGGMGSVLDFFVANGRPLTSGFGMGNWTGLAALAIVVGLLAISTDRSMRELKARRWKNLQRLNYGLFVLVVLHAFFYGALPSTRSSLSVLLAVTVISVVLGQAVGIWLWRHRYSQVAAQPS